MGQHEWSNNHTDCQQVSNLARLATSSVGGKPSEWIQDVANNPSLSWETMNSKNETNKVQVEPGSQAVSCGRSFHQTVWL